ncbi:MAG: GNAT family N-acetyltransferase [Planctomycetes bacterium]|nr:GNAT family N-acetyltransferase [Planctomycetota bacterium]
MSAKAAPVIVRNTRHADFDGIIALSRRVYPEILPWGKDQLSSHLRMFPDGQFVAIDIASGRVVGVSGSLIVLWDDYHMHTNWVDLTDHGMFTNHDPEHGHTLYAAEVMVDPDMQGRGIGKKLYKARREVCRRLGLLRIRAGARLRHYHKYADKLTPEEYVLQVVRGDIGDPTLSFQLKQGFRVIGVANQYLRHDPESLGHAAVIEWVNHKVANRPDFAGRDPKYGKPRKKPSSF